MLMKGFARKSWPLAVKVASIPMHSSETDTERPLPLRKSLSKTVEVR